MSDPANNDELASFHAALARLTPTPDGINVAQLLFRAGQLSVPRRSWAWPCATAASMLLAIALGSMLLLRPGSQPIERIVTVHVPSTTQQPPQIEPSTATTNETPVPSLPPSSISEGKEASDGDYFQLRRQVLAHGLDALPPPQLWSAAMPADDADTLLDLPRGSREPLLLRLKRSLHFGGPS